ncbi:MAG: F0F1 ATP synthase subunit gamma [Holosporales bacterium]|jgi:F-type H+-transporting ATPase subunit gamma|nr:F0F1 ATP synthase subunit gamma [Holosporales bacterium]
MAGLQDIKKRIQTVQSTHKLISAMKLIAASRFRQSIRLLQVARDYEASLTNALRTIVSDKDQRDLCRKYFPTHFFEDTPSKPRVICVFGAQKGLCGNYNLASIKEAIAVEARDAKNRKCEFVPMTLKAAEYFVKHKPDQTEPLAGLGHFSKKATCMDLATYVFDHIKNWYINGEVGAVSIVCGKFVNTLTQSVESFDLYPNKDLLERFITVAPIEHVSKGSQAQTGGPQAQAIGPQAHTGTEASHAGTTPSPQNNTETEPSQICKLRIEPSLEKVVIPLLDTLALVRIYKAFLESETCEFAARMTMMDSSKRNAEELVDKLSLQYNRTRQANITNELIEIIAGTAERE